MRALRVVVPTLVLAVLLPVLLVPRLFGWVGLPVTSTTLEPGIRSGSLVVVDPVDMSEPADRPQIEVDDVVTFTPRVEAADLVTRRVTAVETRSGTTQLSLAPGGRNSADELTTDATAVRAIARYHVPLAGGLLAALPPAHRPWWGRALALACLAYAAWQIWRRREEIAGVEHGEDPLAPAADPPRTRSRAEQHRTGRRPAGRRLAARLDALAGTALSGRRASRGRHRASSEEIVSAVHAQDTDAERARQAADRAGLRHEHAGRPPSDHH